MGRPPRFSRAYHRYSGLRLTADKDVVVPGCRDRHEAKKDYRIFVRNASGVAPGGYPVVAPGQAGIRDYSPTDVTVTTNAAGTRPILFDTNQSTADVRFTIRVEDPADPATFDEVRVQVVRGDITIIATGTGVYSIGEEIFLSGTNTESAITYLFVTGPGLAANGSKLDDLAVASITRDADTFTRADVELDDTWAYRWDTGATAFCPTAAPISSPHAKRQERLVILCTGPPQLR